MSKLLSSQTTTPLHRAFPVCVKFNDFTPVHSRQQLFLQGSKRHDVYFIFSRVTVSSFLTVFYLYSTKS